VKVYVGPNRKLWTLPEDLLCDRISYFRALFKSGFKEGIEKEIYLKEEDPGVFARIVDWLFTDIMGCSCMDICPEDCQLQGCMIYALADKWGLEDVARCILAQIQEVIYTGQSSATFNVTPAVIKYVYEHDAG
jgi:hypothetical protein